MMNPVALDTNFKVWIKGVQESTAGKKFPWRIKVEIPGESKTQIKTEEKTGDPREETDLKSVTRLIEIGTYKEALDLSNQLVKENPTNAAAAEAMGKLTRWIEIQNDVTEKIKENQYELAVDRLETLNTELPPGPGKENFLKQLNELKKKWATNIKVLRDKLKKTKDLKKKNEILDQLIEIVPEDEKQELSRQKNDNIIKIDIGIETEERLNRFFIISFLTAAILGILALIFFLEFYPSIRCQRYFKAIEDKIRSKPEAALQMIREGKETCDARKMIELTEKAQYEVRLNQSDLLIKEAFAWADKKDYDQSFEIYEKVKALWGGLPLPGCIKEEEVELKTRASRYFLEKARDNKEKPGDRFIFYNRAYDYSLKDKDILDEKNQYLEGHKNSILRSLYLKTRDERDCQKAKYLIGLCMEIDPTEPGIIELNEKIYQRCK
jgi:hypothetical protein